MSGIKQYLVDANLLIRLMVREPEAHAVATAQLFEMAKRGEILLTIPMTAINETVFTLRSLYKIGSHDIVTSLLGFLSADGVNTTAPQWVYSALEAFNLNNLSFGDACIAAEAKYLGLEVASFDRGFDKVSGIKRADPREVQ